MDLTFNFHSNSTTNPEIKSPIANICQIFKYFLKPPKPQGKTPYNSNQL